MKTKTEDPNRITPVSSMKHTVHKTLYDTELKTGPLTGET